MSVSQYIFYAMALMFGLFPLPDSGEFFRQEIRRADRGHARRNKRDYRYNFFTLGDSMVTTLYLIRHGETEGSETKRYKGTLDVPLSEKGIKQVERVSRIYSQAMSTIQKEGDTIPVPGEVGSGLLFRSEQGTEKRGDHCKATFTQFR